MTCDEIRLSLGALALGTLDDDEAKTVREHVSGCDECSREYEELRGLPRLLGGTAEVDLLEAGAEVGAGRVEEVLLEVVALLAPQGVGGAEPER